MGDNGETQAWEYTTFDLARPKKDVDESQPAGS